MRMSCKLAGPAQFRTCTAHCEKGASTWGRVPIREDTVLSVAAKASVTWLGAVNYVNIRLNKAL